MAANTSQLLLFCSLKPLSDEKAISQSKIKILRNLNALVKLLNQNVFLGIQIFSVNSWIRIEFIPIFFVLSFSIVISIKASINKNKSEHAVHSYHARKGQLFISNADTFLIISKANAKQCS